MAKIDHVAIRTTEYEKSIHFFEEVFQMNLIRQIGVEPERKGWFQEGIQINEVAELLHSENGYDHFAILVDDTEKIMERVAAYGCRVLRERWFVLNNGTIIELIPEGKEFEQ